MKFLFSAAETGEDLRQVESCETRNTREPPWTVVEAWTVDHQGRVTEV